MFGYAVGSMTLSRIIMNIKFLVFVSLLIRMTPICGQDTCAGYALAFKAEQLYRGGKFSEETVKVYQAAFEYGIQNGPTIFDAITCAKSIADTNAVIIFLTHGLLIGIEVDDYNRLWQFLGNEMDFAHLLSLMDTTEAIKTFEEGLDSALIEEIKRCAIRDQEYRQYDTVDWTLQLANDRLNWKTLKSLTVQSGRFPHLSAVGMTVGDDLGLLFYHMDKDELQWFLPFVVDAIQQYECNLGRIILYQLDQIGMDHGKIYTLTDNYQIVEHSIRTKMKNNMWCQSFGEWFDEQDVDLRKTYFTPPDPRLSIEEINRVRHLLCLDSLESKWKRKPWVNVVTIEEFEQIFPQP